MSTSAQKRWPGQRWSLAAQVNLQLSKESDPPSQISSHSKSNVRQRNEVIHAAKVTAKLEEGDLPFVCAAQMILWLLLLLPLDLSILLHILILSLLLLITPLLTH